MSFAKLSAALLACNDAPRPVMPAAEPSPARLDLSSASSETHKLLAHLFKTLKLHVFQREYDRVARQCAAEGLDYSGFLLRLAELEATERNRLLVERRIRDAQFPALKSLDSFDFTAMPALDKGAVLELARCNYITRRENVIAIGEHGTGKTHVAVGLGLAACEKGLSVGFMTAASLVRALIEAQNERRLSRLQHRLASYQLLIIDELGYVPLSPGGGELLFEVFSQRCERGATMITSNLPIDEWTRVFGCERLTGALLDRLTYHCHLLELRGESYRSKNGQTLSNRGNPVEREPPGPHLV
jgi:DNA replication protein DnaC